MSIDYSARLALVQAAITNILSGAAQAYEIDGRQVTKLDLGMLQREESRLMAKINRAGRTGGAFRLGAPR